VATDRQTRNMTESNWKPEVFIESLTADFDLDGTLNERRDVEVTANYNEVLEHRFLPGEKDYKEGELEELEDRYEPGELIDEEYRNGAYARLRYEVEDGVARLSEFKDAAPNDANWISVEFLRVVHAAEDVVANVPGVEQVVNAEDTLFEELSKSDDADLERY
jgi:hypothetical protein